MAHLDTVREIYSAFGRGDVAAILERLADDVAWEYGGTSTDDVPWLRPRRGRDDVAGFFAALAGMEFHRFEPKALLADGDLVVALVDTELTVRDTGVRLREEDEVHLWWFGADGKVQRFAHKVDSHAHWLAVHGDPAEPVPSAPAA